MNNRLLLRRQSLPSLVLSMTGALLGLLLMLAALQAWLDFTRLFHDKNDLLSAQYLILNKKVSTLNTLGLFQSGFSNQEIAALRLRPEVESVGAFHATSFDAMAILEVPDQDKKQVPRQESQIFFESVPAAFLDIQPEHWKWEPGDSVLPIIIPTEFINLYNFGLAPSQGLPQISKGLAESATMKIAARMPGGDKIFYGKIAGFSDRISSILVPEQFVNYSNQLLQKKAAAPSRLILRCTDPSSPALLHFLDEHGYETNQENLKNARLNFILRIVMSVLLGIGTLIILLSLLSFIQYAQLLIHRSAYELRVLIHLGYYYLQLWKRYFLFYLLLFSPLLMLAFLLLRLGHGWFCSFLSDQGLVLDPSLSMDAWAGGLVLYVFLLSGIGLALQRSLKKLSR